MGRMGSKGTNGARGNAKVGASLAVHGSRCAAGWSAKPCRGCSAGGGRAIALENVKNTAPANHGFQVAEAGGGRLCDSSMSLDAPTLSPVAGARFSFGIAAACFNQELVDGLIARVKSTLTASGVQTENIDVVRVPGSHEVPFAVQLLADKGAYDCLIALGVLIGGDTNHHEMVGNSVSQALQQISLGARRPVINGVIVANTRAQAEARCLGPINRGAEFAEAALAMAALRQTLSR